MQDSSVQETANMDRKKVSPTHSPLCSDSAVSHSANRTNQHPYLLLGISRKHITEHMNKPPSCSVNLGLCHDIQATGMPLLHLAPGVILFACYIYIYKLLQLHPVNVSSINKDQDIKLNPKHLTVNHRLIQIYQTP